jgi:hypothetical protein
MNKRGGKRVNSGRPKLNYISKTIRVPVPVLNEVKEIIFKFKLNNKDQ